MVADWVGRPAAVATLLSACTDSEASSSRPANILHNDIKVIPRSEYTLAALIVLSWTQCIT